MIYSGQLCEFCLVESGQTMRLWHMFYACLIFALIFTFIRLVGELAIVTVVGLVIVLGTCLLLGYSADIKQTLRRWTRKAERTPGVKGAIAQMLAFLASSVFVVAALFWVMIAVATVVVTLIAFVPEFYKP